MTLKTGSAGLWRPLRLRCSHFLQFSSTCLDLYTSQFLYSAGMSAAESISTRTMSLCFNISGHRKCGESMSTPATAFSSATLCAASSRLYCSQNSAPLTVLFRIPSLTFGYCISFLKIASEDHTPTLVWISTTRCIKTTPSIPTTMSSTNANGILFIHCAPVTTKDRPERPQFFIRFFITDPTIHPKSKQSKTQSTELGVFFFKSASDHTPPFCYFLL
mmetsp:Transcript_11500/g.23380  ORF Transcript_11500/g.23380 Transcript_11500/m.23380 type:complete len:218 (+) Transcript_11500:1254-1907(+)